MRRATEGFLVRKDAATKGRRRAGPRPGIVIEGVFVAMLVQRFFGGR